MRTCLTTRLSWYASLPPPPAPLLPYSLTSLSDLALSLSCSPVLLLSLAPCPTLSPSRSLCGSPQTLTRTLTHARSLAQQPA
eukprot:693047-Rhodomonas_salina.1